MSNAQTVSDKDSLCNELINLNRQGVLSSENFDRLCDCIKSETVLARRVAKIRFAESIYPHVDSTKNLHRIYKEESRTDTTVCNGFYWIFLDHIPYRGMYTRRIGINTRALVSIDRVSRPRPIYKDVAGGFKQGVPECIWEYKISTRDGGHNCAVFKQENYSNGLLDGDYTITTISDDTLYHTRFNNGTGYYVDYHPNGKVQMEGNIISGQPDGRWLLYSYDDNEELESIFLEIIQDEKNVFYKRYYDYEKTRKAIQWERQPKKMRKGKRNPYEVF